MPWGALGIAVAALIVFGAAGIAAAGRPGLAAQDPWSCPASHPIKGYVSAEAARRLYFLPPHPFHAEASAERCYATEDEARHDGGRPANTPAPTRPRGELAESIDSNASRGAAELPQA